MPHTTAQQPASGTTLGYGATSGGTFTTLPLVVDITLPSGDQGEVPMTLLASTFQLKGPTGVPDLGEVGVKVRWDPADASHTAMLADVQGVAASRWWKVSYNDVALTTEVFSGWVKGFARGQVVSGGKLESTFTVVLTSVPAKTDNGN